MQVQQFEVRDPLTLPEFGTVTYQCPSNIALVKYWGKYGEQLPKNASISFTLQNCFTKTTLTYQLNKSDTFNFEVYLDGKREKSFEPKILKFFERVAPYLPFLKDYNFKIETYNSFPHSSGIASSASGMSALACALVTIEQQASKNQIPNSYFIEKASFIARLGSGSAARSIEGPLVVWGVHPNIEGSNQLTGIKYPYKVHPIFENYQDTILLVDRGEKQVSSTFGHNLMHNHPFANSRFDQAQENLSKLIKVLQSGNLKEFISIVEGEALSLHAMMLTSHPYFILMKPNTLEIINKIWQYRANNETSVCFTLDAGANVHLLYPKIEKDNIIQFIKKDLAPYCHKGQYICDVIGLGAKKL